MLLIFFVQVSVSHLANGAVEDIKQNALMLFNYLWLATQYPEYRRFWKQAADWPAYQQQLLDTYLAQNQSTAYGSDFGFARIQSYADFARQVPILEDWSQIASYIDRIACNENNVLTAAPVTRFEETSGSTGFSKLIPYNAHLTAAFERAVAVWMVALYRACPSVFRHRAYWSISPALKSVRKTAGGLPVGLEDDTAYFHPVVAWMLRQIMVQPEVRQEKDTQRFYEKTVDALWAARHQLSFISVWSPSFFLQIDQYLAAKSEVYGLSPDWNWGQAFPRLASLSCWTDAQAQIWLPQVQARLGQVPVQGKGLLSTECVTTIPIGLPATPVLAYRSHFFEFRCIRTQEVGTHRLLQKGHDYEVICTNGSGLYRYATQDIVRCTGELNGLPILYFQGRKNAVSDLVGEKLSEAQVIQALRIAQLTDLFQEVIVTPRQSTASVAGYQVHTYGPLPSCTPESGRAALARFEAELCQNPYYRQALATGQLSPAQWVPQEQSPVARIKRYLREQRQIKEGDMKIPVLWRETVI